MANETDADGQGSAKSADAVTAPSPAPPAAAGEGPSRATGQATDQGTDSPVPAEGGSSTAAENAIAAGPAPQIAFTPQGTETSVTAAQPAPAAKPADSLIGSWLTEHAHHADVPYLFIVVVLAFLLGSFVAGTAGNTDVWHHLAVGRLLSEGKYTFGTDPFDAVVPVEDQGPVYWVNHSWLYEWISYMLYSEGGTLLIVLKALCAAGLACILLMIRPRNRHAWVGTLCVLLAVLAMSPMGFALHPMLVSLLFLGTTLLILQRSGVLAEVEKPQPRLLWALPPLFALWINLDSWFIFGPIIVACCLAGLLLELGLGRKPHFNVLNLAGVLGAGLLASLLNPHHIRAVALLPVELSYLLVRLGNFWPDWLVAGGRTVQILSLQAADGPFYQPTLSPVSQNFWSQTTQGFNIAGMSFFVLVLAVAGSFYLCSQANPRMLMVRAVPAMACGVLALLLVRFIPLFAVVGSVVAFLNIQEYLTWRETTEPAAFEEQSLWANMTRIVMGFVFFGLLFLARPGWVSYSMFDFASPRRVAWGIHADSSLTASAAFLKEKSSRGELKRALNISRDIANFCAWHAPEMHFMIDHRLQLFDRQVQMYVELPSAIMAELNTSGGLPRMDWRLEFKRHGIDTFVYPLSFGGATRGKGNYVFMRGTIPTYDLQAIYADGKTGVSYWTRGAGKRLESIDRQWRLEALGPGDGPWPTEITSPESLGFWEKYFAGQPQPFLAAQKALLLHDYFIFTGTQSWPAFWQHPRAGSAWPIWELGCLSMPGNLSVGPMPLLLTTTVTAIAVDLTKPEDQDFVRRLRLQTPPPDSPNQKIAYVAMLQKMSSDPGPPEAALLAIRAARRAVAADPLDPFSHQMLVESIDFIDSQQERAWAKLYPVTPRDLRYYDPLRGQLRNFQLVAALQRCARLMPSDPDIHLALFRHFEKEKCLDIALEHLQAHVEYLDSSKATQKKRLEEAVKELKEDVDGRLKNLANKSGPNDSLFTRAKLAFVDPFEVIAPDGSRRKLPNMGLMQTARKYLLEFVAVQAKREAARGNAEPTDEDRAAAAEMRDALRMLLQIDLQMGNVWELKYLAEFQKLDAQPGYEREMFLIHGVSGDYEKADRALEKTEMILDLQHQGIRQAVACQLFSGVLSLGSGNGVPGPLGPYIPFYQVNAMEKLELAINHCAADAAEIMTVRGILALEAGKTTTALGHFRKALAIAGPKRYFTDRGIAERYLSLLQEKW